MITKEALRELVLEAESLVLQKMSEKTTKKEYFLNEVLAKTNVRKNLHKKVMEKNQKDTAKINRVQVIYKFIFFLHTSCNKVKCIFNFIGMAKTQS